MKKLIGVLGFAIMCLAILPKAQATSITLVVTNLSPGGVVATPSPTFSWDRPGAEAYALKVEKQIVTARSTVWRTFKTANVLDVPQRVGGGAGASVTLR